MKKRLFTMVVFLLLSLGLINTKVYAIEAKLTAEEMSGATEASVNQNCSINWVDKMDYEIYKITIPQKGVFKITADKLISKTFGALDTRVAVYDANGTILWECRDENKEIISPTYYVGLDSGNYYVLVEILLSSSAWGKTSTHQFAFEPNNYAETEPNSTKETATEIVTDMAYTGWIGVGFGETNHLTDGNDIYKVNLVRGNTYKLISDVEYLGKTTICLWCEKDKKICDYWEEIGGIENGESKPYTAKYTGEYYISVYNYSGDQYKYSLEVRTINKGLETPKVKSLKAGKKSFTLKWKKVKCNGYQIQYATNKQMKKAVTKTIKKAGTTKLQAGKLMGKKKYYVRIRAFQNEKGKKKYSEWSDIKTVTTKK